MKSSSGRHLRAFCESLTGFRQGSFIVLPEAASASPTLLLSRWRRFWSFTFKSSMTFGPHIFFSTNPLWRISLSLSLTTSTSDVLRSYNSDFVLVALHTLSGLRPSDPSWAQFATPSQSGPRELVVNWRARLLAPIRHHRRARDRRRTVCGPRGARHVCKRLSLQPSET